jgi:hypothetical protein
LLGCAALKGVLAPPSLSLGVAKHPQASGCMRTIGGRSYHASKVHEEISYDFAKLPLNSLVGSQKGLHEVRKNVLASRIFFSAVTCRAPGAKQLETSRKQPFR